MRDPTLELNIISASDLKSVNYFTKMNVYAVLTLLGDKKIKKVKTNADRYGGSNPNWHHAVTFPVDERLAREGRVTLVVGLFSRRLLGDKNIGNVEVPLVYMLPSTNGNGDGHGHGMKFVTYQVRTPCGSMKGCLNFSYRFSGLPVISGQVPASWAPPSQHGYGPYGQYPYMQQPPPPPPSGYGYQGSQQYTQNQQRLERADLVVSALSLLH